MIFQLLARINNYDFNKSIKQRAMLINKKISIVVPVYKSEKCVETLVKRVDNSLHDVDYELILVNDNGPDNSWEEIKKAAKSNKRIIAINLRKNSGQDNAIMAGFSKVSGNYVVIMDDDLQHEPADIKKLIQELERGDFDVCFAKFPVKKQKLWKNIGSWLNGKMAEIIIKKPPYIYLSPFKIIKKEIVDEIVAYSGPYPYIDGIIFTITRNVTQVPIEHHTRFAGESNYTLYRSVAVWLKLMTNFSFLPLRIATMIGIMVFLNGFLLALFYFTRYLLVGEIIEVWTSLMIIFLILCGTIILSLGCIGEYVGRSFMQLNRRPQYSIKEVLNTGNR
jgi:undecaprenyl-phosphate 4-deoxy-4-formamido-L-arabinose transferase